MPKRDKSRDGLRNRLEVRFLTRLWLLWWLVQTSEKATKLANKFLINNAVNKIPARPYALSTKTPYTSWDSLTDPTYSGLHLPPADWTPLTDEKHLGIKLSPPIRASEEELTEEERKKEREKIFGLFRRRGETKLSPKSSLVFPYFVQWFTDGFLRTDRDDFKKTTSNHHIDLCTVYGLTPAITNQLRDGKSGLLKSQEVNGEEYPPYYYDASRQPKPEFSELLRVRFDPAHPSPFEPTEEEKPTLFATGVEIERANVQVGFMMLNILCLREHNRLVRLLRKHYPSWDGDRLFETARNIVTVEVMKIVMEDYINHITPYHFNFITDPQAFAKARWYRQNWMTVEFSLVYRWHSMLPDEVLHGGRKMSLRESMFDSRLITDHGLANVFRESSEQPAARLGLHNTAEDLLEVEWRSVELGRKNKIRGYNDYRELLKYPRATSFEQLSSDPAVIEDLKDLYGSVDKLEFYVGLYAEDLRPNSALPPMVGRLVGIDAFSQALTNPLLAKNIFNKETFSPVGWDEIMSMETLSDLLKRNVSEAESATASFQNAGWKPKRLLRAAS